jgi:hypothetical protein
MWKTNSVSYMFLQSGKICSRLSNLDISSRISAYSVHHMYNGILLPMRAEYEAPIGSRYNFALKIGCHMYNTCTSILQHRNKSLIIILCMHVIWHNHDWGGTTNLI